MLLAWPRRTWLTSVVQAEGVQETNQAHSEFGPDEVDQWGNLLGMLSVINLSGGQDKICWRLEKSEKYTTKSSPSF
jgi:hypothetical protein